MRLRPAVGPSRRSPEDNPAGTTETPIRKGVFFASHDAASPPLGRLHSRGRQVDQVRARWRGVLREGVIINTELTGATYPCQALPPGRTSPNPELGLTEGMGAGAGVGSGAGAALPAAP